jgi:MFS family permease
MKTTKTLHMHKILLFGALLFAVSFGDAIMSYVTPVLIEDSLKDPFLVGIVISLSSLFGIFFDFYVGDKLSNKNYNFFIKWTIIIAFLFPLIFLFLPRITVFFVLAMIVWSIYYELRNYSKYNFVHNFVAKNEHTLAFSLTNTFQWVAYALGPLTAVYLLDKHVNSPLITAASVILVAALYYALISKHIRKHNLDIPVVFRHKSIKKELKLLNVLIKSTWPLLLFNFAVVLVDVSFWTTGILFAETLRSNDALGGFFMTVYGIPALYVGFLVPLMFKHTGKKKNAYLLGITAGIFVLLLGLVTSTVIILLAVLLLSTCVSACVILLDAVFEDYVARLKDEGNDLISISSMSTNLSYTIGPIILGFIAGRFNYESTFVFTGTLLVIVSIISLAFTPPKIRMPNRDLDNILNN